MTAAPNAASLQPVLIDGAWRSATATDAYRAVDPATGAWNALSGVNLTLGLPIIRTSVDHGTAFDIAGKGVASEQSMMEAVEFAVQLATPPQGEGT